MGGIRRTRTTPWHESDRFWRIIGPANFDDERWEEAGREVEGVVALAGFAPGASVLDLACGPGRHSLELARRGFAVTGVDRTAAFLKEARRRAAAEGVAAEFVREDMRRFVRPRAFDAAILMQFSLGYFEDPRQDLAVLRLVRRSLRKGGVFVVDTLPGGYVPETCGRWARPDGSTLTVVEALRPGRDGTSLESLWEIGRGGKIRTLRFSVRLYAGEELTALLSKAGFRSVDLYADLEGAPLAPGARRMIAVARV